MSSGRVGKAIVLTCFFTAGYGRHRKLGVGFRTAGYGRHRSQWVKQVLIDFTAYDYTSTFLNSPFFQYILRKKRLTFWKISIDLNFISLINHK